MEQIYKYLEDGNYEKIMKYKSQYIPKTLYKFFPIFDERTANFERENEMRFNSLQNNKVWLSSFESFNDPFDGNSLLFDYNILKERGYDESGLKHAEQIVYLLKNIFGISSFTSHLNDCMPMWAHYANNHKGYCVEYEVVNTNFFFPALYEHERSSATNILSNLMSAIADSVINNQNDDSVLKNIFIIILSHCVKHVSWSYEDEFRIIKQFSPNSLVECNRLGINPKAIYAGISCDEFNRKKLMSIANSLDINFHQMEIVKSDKNFSLGFNKTESI